MHFIGKLSMAAALLLATTALVQAADVIPEPAIEPAPEVLPAAQANGWYLRGDIGYSFFNEGDVVYQKFYPGGNGFGPSSSFSKFSKTDLDNAWTFQGGVGYQVNDYFRVDTTYTHFNNSDFKGRSSKVSSFDCGLLSPDNATLDTCSAKEKSRMRMDTWLANAYADLGNYNGITPYVGAGIGGANVKWSKLENDISCKGGDCLNGAGENYSTKHDRSHTRAGNGWRFAWAVHAGASFDVTCNTKIDAGYTYTRVEGGDMFKFENDSALKGAVQGRMKDFGVSTASLGLRYQLGGCQQAYVPQEVPVYK